MYIKYHNQKVEKQCTSLKVAKRAFCNTIAEKLLEKINFIESADSLEPIINNVPLHFHPLHGKREGTYTIDINGRKSGYRLLLKFDEPTTDVFPHANIITVIQIEEVSNHYE